MFRKDLIQLLLNHPMSLSELARLLEVGPKDGEDDLQHLRRSLKKAGYHTVMIPAECRKCGFVFHRDRLRKPGKCPTCKGTWISEPRISIERRK